MSCDLVWRLAEMGDASGVLGLARAARASGMLADLREQLECNDPAVGGAGVPAGGLAEKLAAACRGEHDGLWVAQLADVLALGDGWVAWAAACAERAGNEALLAQLRAAVTAAAKDSDGDPRIGETLEELREAERRQLRVHFGSADKVGGGVGGRVRA